MVTSDAVGVKDGFRKDQRAGDEKERLLACAAKLGEGSVACWPWCEGRRDGILPYDFALGGLPDALK
jgi:hypothetical protein